MSAEPISLPLSEPELRRNLEDRYQPDWTVDAACRDKVFPSGTTWASAFDDELALLPPDQEYTWPEGVLNVMMTCATCPVQRPCLERAFELEHQWISYEWREEEAEDVGDDLFTMPGPDENTVRVLVTVIGNSDEIDRRFGVYGGIPGRQRERFARFPDRIDRCLAWFGALAQHRRWLTSAENQEERTA